MVKIIPAILSDQRAVALRQLELANSDDRIERVQIDVIDGWFAENLTLTPADFAELDFGKLQTDFHLMTEEPLDYLFEILEHREQLPVNAVIAQIERMSSQPTFVEQVKKTGWQVGLALDLFTPVESISLPTMESLDIVQVMTIEAGFQGQAFVTGALEKIQELIQLKKEKSFHFEIYIDGGIKKAQVELLQTLEIDAVMVGSGLWQAVDFSQTFDELISTNK